MPTNLANIPTPYRQNLQRAVEILQNAGCSDVFLFGSLAHGNVHEGTDIDLYCGCDENRSFYLAKNSGSHSEQSIAVRDCPTGEYFNILGKLFFELDYPVDLINLDKPDAFARFLEEQGELVPLETTWNNLKPQLLHFAATLAK